jgi:hypothetical protein
MQRRAFFKLFGNTIYLPFIKAGPAQSAYDGLSYSDSDNNTPMRLAVLSDRVVDSSGVAYAA